MDAKLQLARMVLAVSRPGIAAARGIAPVQDAEGVMSLIRFMDDIRPQLLIALGAVRGCDPTEAEINAHRPGDGS